MNITVALILTVVGLALGFAIGNYRGNSGREKIKEEYDTKLKANIQISKDNEKVIQDKLDHVSKEANLLAREKGDLQNALRKLNQQNENLNIEVEKYHKDNLDLKKKLDHYTARGPGGRFRKKK
jgi:chromosome segregation ATPase